LLTDPRSYVFFPAQRKVVDCTKRRSPHKGRKNDKTCLCASKNFYQDAVWKSNRPSKTYEELLAKYKQKLAQGGKASGRYLPKTHFTKKLTLIQKWQKENENYLEAVELKWSDDQLDHYIAPHPLLGKLTLRELCYFTIYHTEHHLNIIKARLTN